MAADDRWMVAFIAALQYRYYRFFFLLSVQLWLYLRRHTPTGLPEVQQRQTMTQNDITIIIPTLSASALGDLSFK